MKSHVLFVLIYMLYLVCSLLLLLIEMDDGQLTTNAGGIQI